jgi:hypothetical protein
MKETSTEMAVWYSSFVSSAPLALQMALSAVAVVEKTLSARLNRATRFALVLWALHLLVLLCLGLQAAYDNEFRPFLGTWIAFLLNAHLLVQLKFTNLLFNLKVPT